MHKAKVVILGEDGSYADVDRKTAEWALESGHIKKNQIMAVFLDGNPFAHNDPKYAPVANTITTGLTDVELIERNTCSQLSVVKIETENKAEAAALRRTRRFGDRRLNLSPIGLVVLAGLMLLVAWLSKRTGSASTGLFLFFAGMAGIAALHTALLIKDRRALLKLIKRLEANGDSSC
jgi:hypothetical protein